MIINVVDAMLNVLVKVYTEVTSITAIEKENRKLATITYKNGDGEYKKIIEDLNRYNIEII